MNAEQTDQNVDWPGLIGGIIAVKIVGVLFRFYVLPAVLDADSARHLSDTLGWFVIGYLVMPSTVGSRPIPPMLSRSRLLTGFAVAFGWWMLNVTFDLVAQIVEHVV